MSQPLTQVLREMREQGRLVEAQALLCSALQSQPNDSMLAELAWQHESFWWQPLQGRHVRLLRRGEGDVALVRRCWAAPDFLRRFNRGAAPLPADDAALRALLAREHWALPAESHALHWTVFADDEPLGFVSIVEWSLANRRAEFLIGLLPRAPVGTGAEASHLALGFLASHARVERLTASFYPDNPVALDLALRLGFAHEGVLRGHLRHPDGSRMDLILAGLLLDDAFFARNRRLRRRLLGAADESPSSLSDLENRSEK